MNIYWTLRWAGTVNSGVGYWFLDCGIFRTPLGCRGNPVIFEMAIYSIVDGMAKAEIMDAPATALDLKGWRRVSLHAMDAYADDAPPWG
jgi:hypothetical protein